MLCNALARKADEYARDFGAEAADLSPPSPAAEASPTRVLARAGAGNGTAAAASAAADGEDSDAERSTGGAQKEADSEPAPHSVAGPAHADGNESDQKRRRYLTCAAPQAPREPQRARARARARCAHRLLLPTLLMCRRDAYLQPRNFATSPMAVLAARTRGHAGTQAEEEELAKIPAAQRVRQDECKC